MVDVEKKRKKKRIMDVLPSEDARCSPRVVKTVADKDKKKRRKENVLPSKDESFNPVVAIDVMKKNKKHMKFEEGGLDEGEDVGVRSIKEKKCNRINGREDGHDGTESSSVTWDLKKSKKMEKNKKAKKKKEEEGEEMISNDDCDLDVIHLANEMNNKKRKKMESDEVDKGSCLSSVNEKKSKKKKKRKKESNGQVGGAIFSSKGFGISNSEKRRKKTKSMTREVANNETVDYGTTDKLENSLPAKKRKHVTFSAEVEIFPSDNKPKKPQKKIEHIDGQIHGKRFTLEEDNLLREAVYNYIEVHQLGDAGLDMVLNTRKYREMYGCWSEIALAIPWRPKGTVYRRTKVIFCNGGIRHKWTPEEIEIVKRHQENNGREWVSVGLELGIHRSHVKDAWRRNRLPNVNKGKWSQDELQKLFDLVNLDYRMSFAETKDSKHGMLRDNISWEAISDKIATRLHKDCCIKWYTYLSSPMVSRGLWYDSDDYLLIDALRKLEACCTEDVDWDNLLEHRSGELCRDRWEEMTKYIGGHQERSFMEQVDVLSNRYSPEMYEYRVKPDEDGDGD